MIFRFARTYMLRYWWWYLLGTVALFATNWLGVTIPMYLAEAIDAIEKPDGLGVVWRNALIVAVMGLSIIGVRTLSRVLFFTPGRLAEAAIKDDLFHALIHQQPSFLRRWSTGDLISRASSDVNTLRLLAGFGVLSIVNVIAVVLLTGTQMLRISPFLALLVVGPLVVGFAVTQLSIRRLFLLMRRGQKQLGRLSDHILSSYQGASTIQGFVAEDAFRKAFVAQNDAYLRTTLGLAQIRVLIGPILAIAASVAVFTLLFFGGPMVIGGSLSTGELVAFTALVAYLAGPLRGIGFIFGIFKQAQASLERFHEVVDPPPERPDLPNPEPAPPEPPSLEIRGLTFRYPGAEVAALQDVSVSVPAGTTLGVLGPTGAGKSTLVACLARLYNPPPGTILVDGVDLRAIDLDAWRREVAIVPQRAWLFSESLRDNVLLGADPERLEPVLEMTALEADVAVLRHGIHTVVGESGVMLSGGQRQRTALARGLIRDPVLLVLDDVLSAVDHTTEAALVDTLTSTVAGRTAPTMVIVAHRISAIQHAETILVLDRGRVADVGTHAELIERPGLYQDTWLRQREGDEA